MAPDWMIVRFSKEVLRIPLQIVAFFLRGRILFASNVLVPPRVKIEIKKIHHYQFHAISGLYYKCFTIVIYHGNDSDQYYKTRITIVIDDPSLS